MTLAAPEGLLYSDEDLWVEGAGDIRRVGVTAGPAAREVAGEGA